MENEKKEQSITIELQHPITVKAKGGNAVIKELTLGRIKAKHLKTLPPALFQGGKKGVGPNEIMPLLASLAGVDEEIIEELDMVDLMEAAKRLTGFLETSLAIGKR